MTTIHKKNYGDTDVAKVAYPKFLEKLSICRDMFHGYDYSRFMTGTDLERAKTISGAVNFIIAREKEDEKDTFVKEALMLHQALSLCSSLVDEAMKFEAAFKTITCDNGCENLDFEGLERSVITKQNRTKVYYAHPYSAWERGSNENANKLIRRFIPKGANIILILS